MAKVLRFPERVRTLALSQREPSVDAVRVDAQLSELTSSLSRLKKSDSNHDLAVATFVIAVALSHSRTALQLVSDPSLKQQFQDKLDEINELLQAAMAKNA